MGLFDDVLNKVGEPFIQSKGFTRGTHEVVIGKAEAKAKKVKNDDAAPVIEVVVFDPEDEERSATCTLYFHTDGGAKISVAKVLGMLVHKVGEAKKDSVRDHGKKLFASITDKTVARDISAKLINDKLIGERAFLVAEPNGKYDTTSYGDIWHYPYELKEDLSEDEKAVGGKNADDLSASDMPDFDGGDDL